MTGLFYSTCIYCTPLPDHTLPILAFRNFWAKGGPLKAASSISRSPGWRLIPFVASPLAAAPGPRIAAGFLRVVLVIVLLTPHCREFS